MRRMFGVIAGNTVTNSVACMARPSATVGPQQLHRSCQRTQAASMRCAKLGAAQQANGIALQRSFGVGEKEEGEISESEHDPFRPHAGD